MQNIIKKMKDANSITSRMLWKASTVLLITLLWVGLNNVGGTRSYYNDTESSSGNSFVAGALDFVLHGGDFVPGEAALNFEPSTTTSKTVGIAIEPNSNPIKYRAKTANLRGDTSFCNAIILNSSLAGENQFTGKLVDFNSSATTTLADWQYDFSLPDAATFYNNVCSFDFEYTGRQTFPHNEYADSGYRDVEKVSNSIASWGLRINKVYYDVDSVHGEEGDNEWVELYNQTNVPLDIKGWKICDNSTSCNTIPAETDTLMIPAYGFAVITSASTTWKYWDIPSDIVRVELGKNIGSGLSNTGDSLTLRRPDDLIIDQMNWGTDTTVWSPAVPGVAEGHMIGRKPNGHDTNQASDFIDLAPPTVLLINPTQATSQTWYWGYAYNITWNATNPNGPDSDIKINLTYIKDTDGSGTITDGDETVIIDSNLSNSGEYRWQLPSGFLGYIWVKIVAVGPENPMLTARMVSGRIWDPIPPGAWATDPQLAMEALIDSITPATSDEPADEEPTDEEATTQTEEENTPAPTDVGDVPPATEPEEVVSDVPSETTTSEPAPESAADGVTTPEVVIETTEPVAPAPEPEIIPETEPAEQAPAPVGVAPEVTPAPEVVQVPEPEPTPEPVVAPAPAPEPTPEVVAPMVVATEPVAVEA